MSLTATDPLGVLGVVIQAQCIDAASIKIEFEVPGKVYQLAGHRSTMLPIGRDELIVCLLTPESTPQHTVVSPTVREDFKAALERSMKGAGPFYTVLRPNWNHAAFVWTLESWRNV